MELPWFRVYAKETLSDEAFQSWDVLERGAWFTLLLVNWREGSIPGDLTTLAKLLHVDHPTMRSIWSSIGSRFVEHPDHEGRLASPRLEMEREKSEELAAKKSKAGKVGATSRWDKLKRKHSKRMRSPSGGNGGGMAPPMANDSDPDPNPDPDSGSDFSQPAVDASVPANVEAFRQKLAGRLEVQNFGIGRNAESVAAFFASQLAAVGEDALLTECCDLAPKFDTWPGSLAAFVGWLQRLPTPTPKEARS